ncbi:MULTISPECIES: DUF928 domain-containing protein [Planktothricoides]|uniref:DUF928 domain-containing protein n=2 Tax=Planktothricoides raciborskii TaxID=132608 RepID=A0ABR8EH34_9CYAN|nr:MULTISPECIES: DUF928 domain-containing protein [Planktothricoides]KOR36291.1 hypothetical protein AM228_13820 [Planktothricoides sp. SR001]MBD2545875.1 DUF928 domain-containing protein [Planktothricoides raciborskii FACHB-1370]MBD2584133.1 DUF928 domain-containing protein [Planktothricoides raciborskii FACHB-1261]
MLTLNFGKKKCLTLSMIISLPLLLQPLFNLPGSSAQSSPEIAVESENNSSANHGSDKSRSNRLNSPPSVPESPNPSNDTFFNPPNKGAPKRTADAGARGPCLVYGQAQPVTLLIPNYQSNDPTVTIAASTVSDYPTLLWYVPQVPGLKYVGLTLIEEQTEEIIYQTTVPVPPESGIMRFKLPSSEPPLKVGHWYEWFLSVSSSENSEAIFNSACYANAYIGRLPLNSRQQEELSNAANNPQALWNFYTKEVIWYDALATLDQMRRQNLENEKINQTWQALLAFSGLADLSAYPPVDMTHP